MERGDDTSEALSPDTRDLAEQFIGLYWRRVLPWVSGVAPTAGRPGASQATGNEAVVLNKVAAAHERYEGSLTRWTSATIWSSPTAGATATRPSD